MKQIKVILCFLAVFLCCSSIVSVAGQPEIKTVLELDNQDQFDITIVGSLRVRDMETPWNQTEGIYAEIVNNGPDVMQVNIGYDLIGISTIPINNREVLIEDAEFPVGPTYNIGIFGGVYGIGVLSFTVFIEGVGNDSGFEIEKTAYGICCGRLMFLF